MRPNDTSRQHVLALSSDLDLRRRFMVLKEALAGNLRFGLLLEVLDRLAADTALDYAHRSVPDARVVTAAVDEIVVRHLADVTQDLTSHARVNHVGRSSMEIGIRVELAGEIAHLASCYFTMVARDGDGPDAHSIPLPPLAPEDEAERTRDSCGARPTDRRLRSPRSRPRARSTSSSRRSTAPRKRPGSTGRWRAGSSPNHGSGPIPNRRTSRR